MKKLVLMIIVLLFCVSCGRAAESGTPFNNDKPGYPELPPGTERAAEQDAQNWPSESGNINVGCSLQGGLVLENTITAKMKEIIGGENLPIDIFFMDGKSSSEIQLSQVEYFISRKSDIIILSPVSYAESDAAILAAKNAGIPLIIILSRVSEQNQAAGYVGAQNMELAARQCEIMAEKLGGKGRIVILEGVKGSGEQLEKTEGYEKVLSMYPQIEVAARQCGNFNQSEAYGIVENWLYNDLKFDAILSQNDSMALGAIKAIDEAIAMEKGELAPKIYGVDADAAYQSVNSSNPLRREANPENIERYESIMVFGGGGDKSGALGAINDGKLMGTLVLDEKAYADQIIKCVLDMYGGDGATEYIIEPEEAILP